MLRDLPLEKKDHKDKIIVQDQAIILLKKLILWQNLYLLKFQLITECKKVRRPLELLVKMVQLDLEPMILHQSLEKILKALVYKELEEIMKNLMKF